MSSNSVYLLDSLTGLQMKSAVISELGLSGGFQHYYLRCNGAAFGSRTPISAHPSFAPDCLLVMEDVGDRPKPSGHT